MQKFANQLWFAKSCAGVRTYFANPVRSPTANAKTNSHLKAYLKPSRPCFHFARPICSLRNPPSPCDAQASIVSSPLDGSRPPIWRGDPHRICETQTWASHSISHMAQTRGGRTDSSLSHEPRPRASPPQDSTSQAPKALTIPFSEGGVPYNPPQRRYETRRPPTTHPGWLLRALKAHYVALQLRGPGLQALESCLDIHSRILDPLPILNVILACHRKPSSNDLWSPRHPLREIHIVEPDHSIPSYILTSRSCDSSRSFRIHLDGSRGTISSTLWLLGNSFTP